MLSERNCVSPLEFVEIPLEFQILDARIQVSCLIYALPTRSEVSKVLRSS